MCGIAGIMYKKAPGPLGEDLLDAVCQGHISTWAASRILAPLARANTEHAEALSRSLLAEPLCTRELAEFYRCLRARIVSSPNSDCCGGTWICIPS